MMAKMLYRVGRDGLQCRPPVEVVGEDRERYRIAPSGNTWAKHMTSYAYIGTSRDAARRAQIKALRANIADLEERLEAARAMLDAAYGIDMAIDRYRNAP
jgi:hypothetical protein